MFTIRRKKVSKDATSEMPAKMRDACRMAVKEQSLTLNRTSMDKEATTHLCVFLSSVNLRSLDITDSKIAQEDLRRVFRSLHVHGTMRKLDLSNMSLGDSGVRLVAKFIKRQPKVEDLTLANATVLGRWGNYSYDWKKLMRNIAAGKSLVRLDLSGNNIGRTFRAKQWAPDVVAIKILADAVSSCLALQHLNLSGNSLCGQTGNGFGQMRDEAGLISLMNTLVKHEKLRMLDLSSCGLGATGLDIVGKLVGCNGSLLELYLSQNGTEPKELLQPSHADASEPGATAFAQAVSAHGRLQCVHLVQCGLRAVDAICLLRSQSLKVLDLSSNDLSGGCINLGKISKSVESLCLADTSLSSERLVAEIEDIAQTQESRLKHLSLANNLVFGTAGVDALVSRTSFTDNPSKVTHRLTQALNSCRHLRLLDLSQNGRWAVPHVNGAYSPDSCENVLRDYMKKSDGRHLHLQSIAGLKSSMSQQQISSCGLTDAFWTFRSDFLSAPLRSVESLNNTLLCLERKIALLMVRQHLLHRHTQAGKNQNSAKPSGHEESTTPLKETTPARSYSALCYISNSVFVHIFGFLHVPRSLCLTPDNQLEIPTTVKGAANRYGR